MRRLEDTTDEEAPQDARQGGHRGVCLCGASHSGHFIKVESDWTPAQHPLPLPIPGPSFHFGEIIPPLPSTHMAAAPTASRSCKQSPGSAQGWASDSIPANEISLRTSNCPACMRRSRMGSPISRTGGWRCRQATFPLENETHTE